MAEEATELKRCSRCGLERESSEFYVCKVTGKLSSWCRRCAREKAAETYASPEGCAKKKAYQYSEETKKRRRAWKKKKFSESPGHRAAARLQVRMSIALSARGITKPAHVSTSLGCSYDELRSHLERQFAEGMSWENYGRKPGCWSIDHIVPLSLVDLNDAEQFRKVVHFTNLRPLWQSENSARTQRDRLSEELRSLGLLGEGGLVFPLDLLEAPSHQAPESQTHRVDRTRRR